MKLVNLFTEPRAYCEDATGWLLEALNIKYTKTFLRNKLIEHPDYPSLASIADTIGLSYDVACAPIRMPVQKFRSLPDFRIPFLAQINVKDISHDVFTVVTEITKDRIMMYNPFSKKQENISLETFNDLYKGVLLIVEAGHKTCEDDYEINLKKERQNQLHGLITTWALPLITFLVGCFYWFSNITTYTTTAFVFLLFTLMGGIFSALLLWHEVDKYNPVFRQICKATHQVNCSAVLSSAASKIMGISWSSIGFTYFSGIILTLLLTGISGSSLILAAWTSILALSYSIFSIYYQWRIIRQWCLLCLFVQGTIVFSVLTAFQGGLYNLSLLSSISVFSIISFFVAFLFPLVVILILMPALQKGKISRQKNNELQRLKLNPMIFEGLLVKQKKIERPDGHLGISFGKPDTVYRIIKVCNPYCDPCAKAHPAIDELVNNIEEVSLQIIFTATMNEDDKKSAPVMHLMSIASKGDEILTRKALDDWYTADQKDYDVFAAKYPVNGEFDLQSDQLKAMHDWCKKTHINYTPTLFISINNNETSPDFYELPEMYSIIDLKNFLTI